MSSHKRPRRRAVVVAAAGALSALVVGTLAVVAINRDGSDPSPTARMADVPSASARPSSSAAGRKRHAAAGQADLSARAVRKLKARIKRQHKPNPDNPLANRPWGVYKGRMEQSWGPYASASGETKTLLGKIALTPKSKWFGGWIPASQIGAKVRAYIDISQAGNPNALVQMALFRVHPWERNACHRLPTAAEQADYKAWINAVAGAVGDQTHMAIILQPDGPFALCAPHGSTLPSQLISYAAQTLSALDHTSVYIDAGAADWPADPGQGGAAAAVRFLVPDGIRYARGIALNSTHYSAVTDEVDRAAQIIRLLDEQGIHGKKAVINTANSGHPFVFGSYTGPDPDDAYVCRSLSQAGTCVALGLPPTTDVANPKWGLSAETNKLAAQYVDAYMWFGRPWLHRQADPFVMSRALTLARVWKWG